MLFSNDGDDHAKTAAALHKCIENSWLISRTGSDLSGDGIAYIFPWQLHQKCVSRMLYGDPEPAVIRESKLIDLVIAIIKGVSSQSLGQYAYLPSMFSQSVPKAHFRAEFYRVGYDYTKSGIAHDHDIDFFIPSKKWGVEIMCDGNWDLLPTVRYERFEGLISEG